MAEKDRIQRRSASQGELRSPPRFAHSNWYLLAFNKQVLKSLGITAEDFERYKEKATSEVADENLCVVCLIAARTAIFVPCGHLTTCMNCAERLAVCPICRQQIQKSMKVFR